MSANVKILLSQSFDPWFNLAMEDWIFQEMGDYDHILFLWRNRETVVIGRSQNPWLECHLDKMQQDNIHLARRQSGGGAVFHDLGNTNFTFLSKQPNYRRRDNFDIIINALKKFNINAEISGRNDIVVKDANGVERKISGSAFKEKPDRAFHHGTLLIQADLVKLQDYLNPNKKKMVAKGVKSVRSRVTNLTELNHAISHDDLTDAIVDEFRNFHSLTIDESEVEYIEVENIKNLKDFNPYYQKMQQWDWLYGQTMHFTHRFQERLSWATVDVQLEVNGGVIADARVYSDSLYPDLIDEIQACLIGLKYHPAVISKTLHDVRIKFPLLTGEVDELEKWLLTAFI